MHDDIVLRCPSTCSLPTDWSSYSPHRPVNRIYELIEESVQTFRGNFAVCVSIFVVILHHLRLVHVCKMGLVFFLWITSFSFLTLDYGFFLASLIWITPSLVGFFVSVVIVLLCYLGMAFGFAFVWKDICTF